MPIRSRTHFVTVRLRVDKPITAGQARYAVWNAIHDTVIYGDETPREPWTAGKILVARRAPGKAMQSRRIGSR